MDEKSVTVFALLSEAYKSNIHQKRWDLLVAGYPGMSDADRKTLNEGLTLPEDIFDGILEEETPDGINTLKDLLNNGD